MAENKKIALIYFSRSAALEGQMKAWFSGKSAEKNSALASQLILQSSHIIQHAGFPVFHYHENNQKGETFGERIANAYQEVFSLGYDAIMAVGNDSPEIETINWNEIRDQLASGKCVIGPSLRGGAYLIGITQEAFDKERFQQLPWQTNKLLDALFHFCTLNDEAPYLLKSLRDINSQYDLKKLVKSSCLNNYFKRFILRLFLQPNNFFDLPVDFTTSHLLTNTPFRAPPKYLFS
jgi:hypothetical protein